MKTLIKLALSVFVTLLLSNTLLYAQWTSGGGQTPVNALRGGNEADGSPLYIARVRHEGGLHIGKVRANSREAFIPFGGIEMVVTNFEIYTGRGAWVHLDGNFPPNAIAAGYEADGSALYIARASLGGGMHIGKVRANAREAFIPFGGREEIVSDFEILVRVR